MAVLSGYNDNQSLANTMELKPVPPAVDGPRDAYEIAFRRGDEIVYQALYNVHEWQLGHFYIVDTARIFQRIESIIDAKLDISAASFDEDKYKEAASIEVGIDWLVIVLLGETSKRKRRYGSQEIVVDAFAEISQKPDNIAGDAGCFVRFSFLCAPAAAIAFGKDLEAECEAAKALRQSLGIPAREEVEYKKYLPSQRSATD